MRVYAAVVTIEYGARADSAQNQSFASHTADRFLHSRLPPLSCSRTHPRWMNSPSCRRMQPSPRRRPYALECVTRAMNRSCTPSFTDETASTGHRAHARRDTRAKVTPSDDARNALNKGLGVRVSPNVRSRAHHES